MPSFFFAESSDYIPLESSVMLMPGSNETCFFISIIDDEIHELAESFLVRLSSSNPRVEASTMELSVTIRDEDGEGE